MATVVEGVPEKVLFFVAIVQVADESGSVRHCGKHSLLVLLMVDGLSIQPVGSLCGLCNTTRCQPRRPQSASLLPRQHQNSGVFLGPLIEKFRTYYVFEWRGFSDC